MPGGTKADNPIKGPPKLSFPTFGNTASKYPQKVQAQEKEEEEEPKAKVNPTIKEEKSSSNDFASFGTNMSSSVNNNPGAFASGFGSASGDLQDSQFNPIRNSMFTTQQLNTQNNTFDKPT